MVKAKNWPSKVKKIGIKSTNSGKFRDLFLQAGFNGKQGVFSFSPTLFL